MTALRSLVAATDFSAPARHAAERAALIAKTHGAHLTVVHVPDPTSWDALHTWLGNASDAATRLEKERTDRLARLSDDLRQHGAPTVDAVCRTGSVPEEISREAEARQADLLVVGARGEGFLRHLVLGSTAERLLRRTTRPVLVARQLPRQPYRRVLVAVDFSPWSAQAVALARRLVPQAHLTLFHAWQVPFEGKLQWAGVDLAAIEHFRRKARADALHQVAALAAQMRLPPECWEPSVVEGHPSLRLVEQEQECDADLLVIGKHGRSATEDLLLGSVTQHVLAEGACDVLVSVGQDAKATPSAP
jgi:nucleotide-binding universal stress UspA family protein